MRGRRDLNPRSLP